MPISLSECGIFNPDGKKGIEVGVTKIRATIFYARRSNPAIAVLQRRGKKRE